MTTNQTIDGVPRELLERLLTDACNENWSDLNELLHSPTACRCKRYGKGNPHWPCPLHASPAAQHQVEPTEEMKEAGCQAYMDADGMIGIMHRSSMGHAYQAMRALEQPAPVAVVLPSRDQLRDIIAQAIGGDTYDCVRVWSAWGVGTMSEDDFVPVVEQEARLYEIADACLEEVTRLNTKE